MFWQSKPKSFGSPHNCVTDVKLFKAYKKALNYKEKLRKAAESKRERRKKRQFKVILFWKSEVSFINHIKLSFKR